MVKVKLYINGEFKEFVYTDIIPRIGEFIEYDGCEYSIKYIRYIIIDQGIKYIELICKN